MKDHFKTIICYCVFLLQILSGRNLLFAQSDLVSSLNKNIVPITALSAEAPFQDLKAFDAIFNNKRIIGLGEATHGTKEFFLYKDRMIRYLISNHDFKTIILEADFAGTQLMNDYVIYDKGSIAKGIEGALNGTLPTKEFIDMVEWIKEYNTTKPMGGKVKFYGCDMQYGIRSGTLLKNETIKLDTPLSPIALKGLDLTMDWRNISLTKEVRSQLDKLSSELSKAKVIEQDQIKQKFYTRVIETLLQRIEYMKEKYVYDKNIVRDKYMAENTGWIYRHESGNKMIVWAHNLHVAKDLVKDNNQPMGSYLAKNFPDEYYVFGFGFNAGQFSGINTEGEKGVFSLPDVSIKKSSDYIFKQVNAPNFILDFKAASRDAVIKSFLSEKLHARGIGMYDEKRQRSGGDGSFQALIKLYDAIIFIRDTSPLTFFSIR